MQNLPHTGGLPHRPIPATNPASATTSSSSTTTTGPVASSVTTPSREPASTMDTAGGVLHRIRRARMEHKLGRSVAEIRQATVRIPAMRNLSDLDDPDFVSRNARAGQALRDRLAVFGCGLERRTPDAKAARAVAVRVLLARHGELRELSTTSLQTHHHHLADALSPNLFDAVCRRTLAALDLRGNPSNLAQVLAQLEPQAVGPGGVTAMAGVTHVISELVGALAQPSLSEAHARQLVGFVMRDDLGDVPAGWLASSMKGLHQGSVRHRAQWPARVPIYPHMVDALRRMSPQQIEALGVDGPPVAVMFTHVLRQSLPPEGLGIYVRGVLRRLGNAWPQMAPVPGEVMTLAGLVSAIDGMFDGINNLLVTRVLLACGLECDLRGLFAVTCVLSRHLGQARLLEVWEQVVDVVERDPPPTPAQEAQFRLAARLAWAPLTVLGETDLAMPDKMEMLRLLHALVGVPVTALGWTQLADIHRIEERDADRFVTARGEPFIRQVFELTRDRQMKALQAVYAKVPDGKAPPPRKGFPAHVPLAAQALSDLLASFDTYERRSGWGDPCMADDPRMAVHRDFLKAQGAWLQRVRKEDRALPKEVLQMLQDQLAVMQASLHEAVEAAQLAAAFANRGKGPAATSVTTTATTTTTTRREGKGDEPDGDGAGDVPAVWHDPAR